MWVDDDGRLRAARTRYYEALPLQEVADAVRPGDHAVLADAWLASPRNAADAQLRARLAFCSSHVDATALVHDAAVGVTSLAALDLERALPWEIRQQLLTDAPQRLPLPSGRTAVLHYGDDGSVAIQELENGTFDFVDLRAEMDLIVALSACPQERNPGNNWEPKALRVLIHSS